MKIKLLLFFLLFSGILFGQSLKLEQYALLKQYEQTRKRDRLSERMQEWAETIKQFGTYPELPLTDNGEVYYSLIGEFSGIRKPEIFNRTLEWLAIRFQLYPNAVYQNPADGKIIFHNSMPLSDLSSLEYTCIISIKDLKLLFEVMNISYQQFVPGRYAGENWIPDKTITKKMNEFYPVILKDETEWQVTLELFKSLNGHVNESINSLYDYVSNAQLNDF